MTQNHSCLSLIHFLKGKSHGLTQRIDHAAVSQETSTDKKNESTRASLLIGQRLLFLFQLNKFH